MKNTFRSGTVALLLLLGGCAAGPTPEEHNYAAEGHGALVTGDLARAEVLLTQALEVEPDNAEAMVDLGKVYEETDRREFARSMYLRVQELEPQLPPEQMSALGEAEEGLKRIYLAEAAEMEPPVEERPLVMAEPEPAPAPEPVAFPYWVQIGVFAKPENVERRVQAFTNSYGDALVGREIRPVETPEGTKLRVGPFGDKESADALCSRLKAAGEDCFPGSN